MSENQQIGFDIHTGLYQGLVRSPLSELLSASPRQHAGSVVDTERVGVAAILNQAVMNLLIAIEKDGPVLVQLKIGGMHDAKTCKRNTRTWLN
jgi:hypothetical protein